MSDGTDIAAATRKRRWLYVVGIIATAVVLAGVIFGVAALSKPDKPDATRGPTAFDESSRLYDQGLAALESGDESAAAEFFARSLAVDPTNSRADEQLDQLDVEVPTQEPVNPPDDPGDPEPSTEPTPPVPDPDAGFTDPVDDMKALLPETVTGYDMGPADAVGPDATMAGEPTPAGPANIRSIFLGVHDFESSDDADIFVSSTTLTAFPENGANVTVDGVPGYFGTDGERFAAVAFARGRFAFQVILSTDSGAPGTLMDAALEAAEAFPDSL